MDSETTQTIFDIYRDWPFLGIIAAMGGAIYLMFRHIITEHKSHLELQKESRQEYLENNKTLWDKHKSERDEIKKEIQAERDDMKKEIHSRDQRTEAIMQKLISHLEQDRK